MRNKFCSFNCQFIVGWTVSMMLYTLHINQPYKCEEKNAESIVRTGKNGDEMKYSSGVRIESEEKKAWNNVVFLLPVHLHFACCCVELSILWRNFLFGHKKISFVTFLRSFAFFSSSSVYYVYSLWMAGVLTESILMIFKCGTFFCLLSLFNAFFLRVGSYFFSIFFPISPHLALFFLAMVANPWQNVHEQNGEVSQHVIETQIKGQFCVWIEYVTHVSKSRVQESSNLFYLCVPPFFHFWLTQYTHTHTHATSLPNSNSLKI